MDPVTIASTTFAIAKISAQCIVSLTVWVGEVKTVDERVEGFCAEIKNLGSTLDALNGYLLQPEFDIKEKDQLDAASWITICTQLKVSLVDCERTMEQLSAILEGLKTGRRGRTMGIFRKPIKQFRESLESGQISILRERILFFTSSLGLAVQMLNL
jgi:hypothetical protein